MAKQPVALIHCALGKAGNWRGMLNALGTDVSPLLIELPGHGLAEEWDRSRDFTDHASELALDEMPSKPVPLIGHSYGAVLALKLALERPYRVSSLILIEPVFFAAAEGTGTFAQLKRNLEPFEKKMKSEQYATAAKLFHEVWGTGDWDDLSMSDRTYMTNRMEVIPAGTSLLYDDKPGLLREGRVEALDIPVTFVDGGDSHPIIEEIISRIGDRLPDAEWVTVPGADHMVSITHPDVVANGIRERIIWETEH